jgi:hypothetical protein
MGFNAQAFHDIPNLRSSPVNHNGMHPHALEQHNVSGKRIAQGLVYHSVTTILNDDNLTCKLLNIRQRFYENVRMLNLTGNIYIHGPGAFLPIRNSMYRLMGEYDMTTCPKHDDDQPSHYKM